MFIHRDSPVQILILRTIARRWIDPYRTACRPGKTGEAGDEGAFTGTVLPDEAYCFSGSDAQINAFENAHLPVRLTEGSGIASDIFECAHLGSF
jgi:hypothetical protein